MTANTHTLVRMVFLAPLMARSKSAIYKQIEAGTFPKPFKLGRTRKISAWHLEEAKQVLAAEVAGQTDDELHRLVKTLVAKRDSQ